MKLLSRSAPAVLCLFLAGTLAAESENNDQTKIQTLARAYASCCTFCEENRAFIWPDGTVIPWDDGEIKTEYEDLLNRASLRDQKAQSYTKGWTFEIPLMNQDTGSVRNEAYFKKINGASSDEVRSNLVAVPWLFGKSISETRINGVDQALARIRDKVAGESPEIQGYVKHSLGSFNWRVIAGTERLSMHSFGIAVDFKFPDGAHRYWRWSGEKDGNKTYHSSLLHNTSLAVIVEIFEEEGFIWGGKWYHHDTMHFEYRPELLDCSEGE